VREPEPDTIRRARTGDLRAFESLVRDYQADVWRFAYHLTRNRTVAEDVTQEAFLKAFRSMASFRGDAKFSSWLLRITRNCAFDAYRRTRHEGSVDDDVLAALAADRRPGPAEGPEERLRLSSAVRDLPLELREPFVVIEVLGFDYREASAILGVKLGTIKSRMHRARAALVRALREVEAAGEV
jgi:RNA polymerase sigma-70 factor, ECF subfamily